LVGLKISVLKDSPYGMAVYEETQSNTTNENGLLSIEVGGGTPITGTFSAINWSTGVYYLKTETDPNGGNNYSISGVGQLLSVPYALYSTNSQNPGKSTIVLTGNITDSEAAAQIASEFGVNTENLIIDNTTVLTTVDLSMFKKLLELKVTENEALTSVSMPQLKSIYNNCSVASNPALTTLNLPLYEFVSKEFNVSNNPLLTNLTFPSLTKARTYSGISIYNNATLISVAFPQLSISNGSLSILENSVITNIDLGNLTNAFNISINSNTLASLSINSLVNITNLEIYSESLTSLNLSNLVGGKVNVNVNQLTNLNMNAFATGNITIGANALSSLSLPSFTSGDFSVSGENLNNLSLPIFSNADSLSIGATLLTELTFPALTRIVYANVIGSPSLTTLNFPSLTTLGQILVSNNFNLSQVTFPVLNQIIIAPGSTYLQFSPAALTSESVNYLLNKFLNASPANGKYIILQNQNPPAPPTGQGILDKQALLDAGNSVTTD
jgi:hypothetical protein